MTRKKQKKGCKIIRMGHLPYDMCIIYNMPYREIVSFLKKHEEGWLVAAEGLRDELSSDDHHGLRYRVEYMEGTKTFFFLKIGHQMDLTIENMAIISHEAIHITQFAFRVIRADLHDEKENTAYFQEFIFREAANFISDTNEK